MDVAAMALEYLPAVQALHVVIDVAPQRMENVPAGQLSHIVLPGLEANFPTSQS